MLRWPKDEVSEVSGGVSEPVKHKDRVVAQAVVLVSVAVIAQVVLYLWAGASALAFVLVTGNCHR